MDRPALLLGIAGMIFDSLFDVFRGKAVTIPPMDGALRPNTALDDSASEILEVSEPDNLCGSAEHVFYSSGHDLMTLEGHGEGPAAAARLMRQSALLRVPQKATSPLD